MNIMNDVLKVAAEDVVDSTPGFPVGGTVPFFAH